MPDESKHGMECAEFETLLSHAIDSAASESGGLSAARKESFEAHRRVCPICGPMFAEVQAGRQWLQALEEVEPPTYLVHNILTATSGVISKREFAATGERRATPFTERAREWGDSFFTPVSTFVRQPRFVMSFGMIFFSFSLALSAAGVKPKDVAKIDVRPSALRHAYNDAQIKVVKYYDNIRFVYEIESKLRELKRTNTPAEPAPQPQKENRKNDTSGQPEQRQDRNYSQDYNQPVLAALRTGTPMARMLRDGVEHEAPVMTGASTTTINRRFV